MAAIWPSIVFAASSPIPVKYINLTGFTLTADHAEDRGIWRYSNDQ
jgi:hypothetical protein